MAKTVLIVFLAAILFVCVSAHRHGGSWNHGNRPGGDGRPHFQAFMDRYQRDCADDQQRLCPNERTPQGPRDISAIFESECFKANSASMSNPCQQMIIDWRNWVSSHRPATNGEGVSEGSAGGDDDKGNTNNKGHNHKGGDDDDDDDDDGDKNGKGKEHDNFESGAVGSPFYEACHNDRVAACPKLPDNVSPHDFFSAKCFHRSRLSQTCEKYLEKWVAMRGARIAAFSILISSTICTIGGLFVLVTLLCCVGCCIRRRRLAMLRRRGCAKKAAGKVVEPAATPLTVQSFEDPTAVAAAEPVDMEGGFPMQTFPAGSAYAPYSYPGAQPYWQPVFFAPPQYTPVPTSEPTQQ